MGTNANIKQIFYADIAENNSKAQAYTVTEVIKENVKDIIGNEYPKMKYKLISFSPQTEGQTDSAGSGGVVKLGYSCRPSISQFPIFITYPGQGTDSPVYDFYIGKTGFFEFQPDSWMDVNSEDQKGRERQQSVIVVGTIAIPWAICETVIVDGEEVEEDRYLSSFNKYESIIDFYESTETKGTYHLTDKPDPYKYSIKPITTSEDFSCAAHIVALVDTEERFIFQVKEKRPSAGCGNCQETIHCSMDAENETAYYSVDNPICQARVSLSGQDGNFSIFF